MTASPTLRIIEEPALVDDIDDAALVRAIEGGDQQALRIAYDRCASAVNGVAISVLRDPHLAADITQEVFVRLWNNPSRFDERRGSLLSYLRMDAHGRSLDLLRSRRSAERRDQADHRLRASTPVVGTEEEAIQAISSDAIREALMSLPSEQRTPIAMAYFDGYSYREVADELGIAEGTIKSRIRRGMATLNAALTPLAQVQEPS